MTDPVRVHKPVEGSLSLVGSMVDLASGVTAVFHCDKARFHKLVKSAKGDAPDVPVSAYRSANDAFIDGWVVS